MAELIEYAFSGINYDLPGFISPDSWSDGNNIEFRRGFATRVRGTESIHTTTVAINGPDYLLNSTDGTNNYWLYGATDGIGITALSVGDDYLATPATFTTPLVSDAWTGGDLNGVPFLNYQTDPGCSWDRNFAGAADMVVLTDAPECGALRAYRFGLVAMDTENSTHGTIPATAATVAWSAFASPGAIPTDWTPGATDEAGFVELGFGGGRCIDGVQFRDSFLIGKTNGFWVMDFVGGTNIMAFRQLFTTGGLLARNCMAEVDGGVYALTDSDLIYTDGNTVRSVIDNVARKHLFDQLGNSFARAFIAYNEPGRELWIAMPEGTDDLPVRVYILDVDNGKFGVRDANPIAHAVVGVNSVSVSSQWSAFTSDDWGSSIGDWKWNRSTAGSVADELIWCDGTAGNNINQADGELDTITGTITKHTLDLGAPGITKLVTAVWPRAEAEPGVVIKMRVGIQDSVDEAIAWRRKPESFTAGTDQKMDILISGRFFSFEFWSESEFALPGFGVEFQRTGRF